MQSGVALPEKPRPEHPSSAEGFTAASQVGASDYWHGWKTPGHALTCPT